MRHRVGKEVLVGSWRSDQLARVISSPVRYVITKASIAVVMANDVPELEPASRIYYGIQHPIQYNLKVKEIGYLPQAHVPTLIGNWRAEDKNDTNQYYATAANEEIPDDVVGEIEEDDSGDEDDDVEDDKEKEEEDKEDEESLTVN
jgi:hypothetical protein